MSIQTIEVTDTITSSFTSVSDSAITVISLCNHTTVTQTASIYLVPAGTPIGEVGNKNIFIKDLEIIPDDTFIVYQGSEKIILENDDQVYLVASANGMLPGESSVTAIISYIGV